MQEEPFDLKCLRPGQMVFYHGRPATYRHHYFNPDSNEWLIIVETYCEGICGNDHVPHKSLSLTIPRPATR